MKSSGRGLDPALVGGKGFGDGEVPKVGPNIKRLRKQQGMTLAELSRRAGISTGMMSQIENDTTNPSLKILVKIRLSLGASFSELFGDAESSLGPTFVRRASERPKLDFGPDRMVKELLSPGRPRDLEVMILSIPPGGSTGDQPLLQACEKAGMVIEGRLDLEVDGVRAHLIPGDSFQFDGRYEHKFGNSGDAVCRVFWIIAEGGAGRHV